nr:Sel1-like repeat protein [Actinomycetes bacterium]
MTRYHEVPTTWFTCRSCDWAGPGALLAQGEVFAEIVEYDCPRCSEKVTFAAFPTREETAVAAQSGNDEAARALPVFDERDGRWERVLETRGSVVLDPPELAEGGVYCALKLDEGGDDTWLVLVANGKDLHRELAVFESTEPARRLLAVMRQRYGDRLRSFDYQPALVYLGGDRLGAVAELDDLVNDLPEPNGCQDCLERTRRNQRGDAFDPTPRPEPGTRSDDVPANSPRLEHPGEHGLEVLAKCTASFRRIGDYFSVSVVRCLRCGATWLSGYYEDFDSLPVDAEWGVRRWVWRPLTSEYIAEIEAADGSGALELDTFAAKQ